MRKIIFSLTMLATFLLGASTVEAQNYPFEEVFTQNLQFHCGGYNRVTNVSLYESPATDADCSTKKMKIVFDLEGYNVIKDFSYEFTIYSVSPISSITTPIYSNIIYNKFAINSFFHAFEVPTQSASANQMYFIQFEEMGLPNSCYAPSQITSPNFSINWKNLPNSGANRSFGLDGNFAHDIAPRVKCAGDNMILKLHSEVIKALNCSYQIITGYPTPPVFCNGAHVGFIITKTDANWTPIDAPKYIGTQAFADAEGVSGSSNFLPEGFTEDPNTGLAKNIHLLDVFNQYMNNNYGYYNIQLKYANYCGAYEENMQINYGIIDEPIVTMEIGTGTPGSAIPHQIGVTSFNNPFTSCASARLTLDGSSISTSANQVLITIERYDNNGSFDLALITDHPMPYTSSNISLDIVNILGFGPPYVPPFDPNNWYFFPQMASLTYKMTIKFTNICGVGDETVVWFKPSDYSCKTGENNIVDNSISSVQPKIYPNPVADELNISYISLQENTTITIRDILGKIVYMENVKNKNLAINQKIDVSTLEKGMYFIEFESINGKEQLKFMK